MEGGVGWGRSFCMFMQLYPHVSSGGLIVFDEYHDTEKYSGARKAIDEFFSGKEKIQKAEFLDRYFVVKE